MQVTTGKAKGRKLKAVPGDTTRPITDRVKHALFNILMDEVADTLWLDLFGGTGAVGIEALSRGARQVTFVDREKLAVGVIEGSGQRSQTAGRAATLARANPMRRAGEPRDIADAVVYLSAPSGDFITGELLTVDGGGVLWGEVWPIVQPDYFKVNA